MTAASAVIAAVTKRESQRHSPLCQKHIHGDATCTQRWVTFATCTARTTPYIQSKNETCKRDTARPIENRLASHRSPDGSSDQGAAYGSRIPSLYQPAHLRHMANLSNDIRRSACITLIERGLVFLILCPSLSLASDIRVELQGGSSYMDTHGITAVFVEAMGAQHSVGDSTINWQPVVSLGWLGKRGMPHHDFGHDTVASDTKIAATGARLHLGTTNSWYRPIFFGFELAYNQHATCALSSHYEFMSTLGWQGRRFSFQLRHISNGGLHDPNRGETMALVGIGFEP